MQSDSPENGVRTIWLNQPTEKPAMISKLIEQRSRTLRAKTRRELIGTITGPLVAGIFYAYSMRAFPTLRHMLQPPLALAIAWGVAGLYFLNRGMWSTVQPGELGLKTGLEACRLEVERQRDLQRRSLVWSFGPAMLATATFVLALALVPQVARRLIPHGLPLLIVLVLPVVSFLRIRSREQRALRRELDELKDLEMENRR
jgi:hypothetical protein